MLRVLDSAGTIYSGLTWRKDSDDLAVLRATSSDKRDGPTHALLAWRAVSSGTPRAFVYDPSTAKEFPAGMRTVGFRRPSWSDDGRIVFAGMARWDEKIPEAAKTTNGDSADAVEELAGVEVWHARDVDVMPRQKISARTDRQRSMLAAWHVESNRFVPLGKSFSNGSRRSPIRSSPMPWTGRRMQWTARSAAPLRISTSWTSRPASARSCWNESKIRRCRRALADDTCSTCRRISSARSTRPPKPSRTSLNRSPHRSWTGSLTSRSNRSRLRRRRMDEE